MSFLFDGFCFFCVVLGLEVWGDCRVEESWLDVSRLGSEGGFYLGLLDGDNENKIREVGVDNIGWMISDESYVGWG